MKVLSHINLLAYQNTSDTRARMKAHGLFDVRDNLIFHLLRGISEQDTIHFINTFSFHSIANQPKFRDNKGIAYLMQWFHADLPSSSSSSYELTLYIYRILYSVFGPIGENRKIISRILDDPMIIEAFLRPTKLNSEQFDDTAQTTELEKRIAEETFVTWYFAEERASFREEVAHRIQKILSPIEAKFKSKVEKSQQKKQKRLKESMERKKKQETLATSILADVIEGE